MEIKDLAISYHETRGKRDEKRRVIDFEHANKLKELEKQAFDVEGRLQIVVFKNTIKNDEEIFEQYSAELQEIGEELKPLLIALRANYLDPLRIHLYNNVHLDVYIDEQHNIISNTFDLHHR